MTDKAERLRALHRGGQILVLPNAWDAASARLFAAEGFPAIGTTSAGVAASLGYRDGGVAPPREMIEAVARIVRSVNVPVSADIEHAYGTTPDAVAEVVLRVIAAGAVGVNIEDCVPGASDLVPLTLQTDKIASIVKAAETAGVKVVINARTDGFLRGMGSPDRACHRRSNAARRFSPPAPIACSFLAFAIAATIAALVKGIEGPINILAVAGTPSVAELQRLGVARVSLGSGPMRASLAIVRDIARQLKTGGTYAAFTDHTIDYDDVNELMG